MLGIVISCGSFEEFVPYQLRNIETFVKVPFRLVFVDNTNAGFQHTYQYDVVRNSDIHDSPSGRHTTSVNIGLAYLWDSCESFLVFDNDMIFLSEWNEPQEDIYYEHTQRGNWAYCWLNLLYFKKKSTSSPKLYFHTCEETYERTDSGGTTGLWLRDSTLTKQRLTYISDVDTRKKAFPEYVLPFYEVCQKHNVEVWFDLYDFNGTSIFHFRAMSNYCGYTEAFMKEKTALIFQAMNQFFLFPGKNLRK